MCNLIKIYGSRELSESKRRDSIGGIIKIQAFLAILVAFMATMMVGAVANASEPEKKNVSEISIKFLDVNRSNGVYEWTGEQIKPFVGFVDANGSSVGENSLRVEYGANVEPGKGTITITGLGDAGTDWQYQWYGTKTFEFEIVKLKTDIFNEHHNASRNINFYYHDGFVISKNIKNDIKTFPGLPDEVIKAIDKTNIENLNISSSNKNVFKVNKNKLTATGVGIAYLNFTIPETDNYKAYSGKIQITSYPPRSDYTKSSNQIEYGNSFRFGVTSGKGSDKCKTDFKCKVIIATNKNFKKSSIIKSYTLSKKEFNKQKIKRIKSNKFKKGATFYIKTYTYKKLSDGKTMYGDTRIRRLKIAKNGRITMKEIKSTDPCIK